MTRFTKDSGQLRPPSSDGRPDARNETGEPKGEAGKVIALAARPHGEGLRLVVMPQPLADDRNAPERHGIVLPGFDARRSHADGNIDIDTALGGIPRLRTSDRIAEFQRIVSGAAAGHDENGVDPHGRLWKRPIDDPAVAVGLAIHFARHCGARGLPIPSVVFRHLDRHANRGNAAAILVRDWIEKRTVRKNGRQFRVHIGGKVQ